MKDPARDRSEALDEHEPEPRGRLKEVSFYLSMVALIFSVPIAFVNVLSQLKGSEIEVIGPDRLLLYKKTEQNKEILSIAVPLLFLNQSPEHTDLLLSASLRPLPGEPEFPKSALIISAQENWSLDESVCRSRQCLDLHDLQLVEDQVPVLELPPGSSRHRYVSFKLRDTVDCKAKHPNCARYRDMTAALKQLEGKRLQIELKLTFFSDGERTISCTGRIAPERKNIDRPVVQPAGSAAPPMRDGKPKVYGWSTMACLDRSISGEPLL